jgi:DNA-binding transcriptional MerR regulator
MLSLFKKVTNRKFTTEERVQIATGKVKSALSLFQEAHAEIEQANQVLMEVVAEDKAKIQQLERNVQRADEELAMNFALQNKLAEFLK